MGLENTNNATVPDGALILPPDAFVMWITRFLLGVDSAVTNSVSANAAAGEPQMVYISETLVANSALAIELITGAPPEISMTGHAFVQNTVDAILLEMVALSHGALDNSTLHLEGGTSAAPSSGAWANITTLLGQGWTITYNRTTVTNAQKLALVAPPVGLGVSVTDGFKVSGAHTGSNGYYKTNGTANSKNKYSPVGFAGEGDISWSGTAWINTHGTFSTDDTTDFWDATDNGGGHTGYTVVHPGLQHYNGTDPTSETHWIND